MPILGTYAASGGKCHPKGFNNLPWSKGWLELGKSGETGDHRSLADPTKFLNKTDAQNRIQRAVGSGRNPGGFYLTANSLMLLRFQCKVPFSAI